MKSRVLLEWKWTYYMEHIQTQSVPYALRDGIRRYGEWSLVTEADIASYRRTPESYLHIVRHMRSLSPEATKRALSYAAQELTGDMTAENYLANLLATVNSKFSEKITDPITIIEFAEAHVQDKVKMHEKLYWHKTPQGGYICHLMAYIESYEKTYFNLAKDEPLGTCNVVDITEDNAEQIHETIRGYAEERDKVPVNCLDGEAPPSDNMVIILYKPDATTPAVVYTAYTGTLAPPVPHETQSPEEYEYNAQWWSQHTFIT